MQGEPRDGRKGIVRRARKRAKAKELCAEEPHHLEAIADPGGREHQPGALQPELEVHDPQEHRQAGEIVAPAHSQRRRLDSGAEQRVAELLCPQDCTHASLGRLQEPRAEKPTEGGVHRHGQDGDNRAGGDEEANRQQRRPKCQMLPHVSETVTPPYGLKQSRREAVRTRT